MSSFPAALLPYWAPAYIAPAVLIGLTGIVGLAAWFDAYRKTRKPNVQMQPTPFNQAVMARCPAFYEPYRPMPFLTNPHVETIFAAKTRATPHVSYRREVLSMSDGGVVALDWEHFSAPEEDLPEDAPVLILLPGLTGGSGDSYVLHAVEESRRRGVRAVVFNSRGTADSPVTTAQFYSASFTGDMRAVVAHVRQLHPNSILLAAGWSLGANILVRYLGEEGSATPISAAVSMCNPFNLTVSNANFEKGFNKIYDWNLASSLKNIFAKHDKVWRGAKGGVRPEEVPNIKTIREFDDAITIHSFGWQSVDQYYAQSSSSLSVPHVTIPLLCIQALDDPIAPKEAIPYEALKENPNCILVCTPCGGHLGWVAMDGTHITAGPWTDGPMMDWLGAVLDELRPSGRGGSRTSADVEEAASARESVPASQVFAASSEPTTPKAWPAAAGTQAGSNVPAAAPATPEKVPVAAGAVLVNCSSDAAQPTGSPGTAARRGLVHSSSASSLLATAAGTSLTQPLLAGSETSGDSVEASPRSSTDFPNLTCAAAVLKEGEVAGVVVQAAASASAGTAAYRSTPTKAGGLLFGLFGYQSSPTAAAVQEQQALVRGGEEVQGGSNDSRPNSPDRDVQAQYDSMRFAF
eukprot:CAMPEP_0202906248 /NCGR_PEP_ID=MMETSP1392-20130828/37919_1 /ASSEMBLY_ACC=CAM_ASM_000868 /TAXON_ID=225041 /ORGANISM="Chlamydomonas chlamydogama, Strain SAG 11-48b" /LENGTH=633 /DNA_ID=CAMNT_0049594653 /DNA_START=364 /DNA_END=2265 /DNA_ORIENTATION=-